MQQKDHSRADIWPLAQGMMLVAKAGSEVGQRGRLDRIVAGSSSSVALAFDFFPMVAISYKDCVATTILDGKVGYVELAL